MPRAPPGKGYIAVGMTRALDSSIGLPSRPRSASWMLVFAMPEDVSRSSTEFLPIEQWHQVILQGGVRIPVRQARFPVA
jgi:hypothetical protein